MVDEEMKIPTSINIYVRQKKWMEDRGIVISDFVRQAIDEKIGVSSGYILEINKTRDKIERFKEEIKKEEKHLTELRQKQEKFEEELDIKNKNDLISRAIINIDYSGWREAARDLEELKGSLSTEEWEGMVRKRWEGVYGERRNS